MATSTSGIGSSVLSSLGIGGFNVQNIAETLAKADVAGQRATFEEKQTKLETRLTGLNTLKQAFLGLQVGLKELAKASTYSQMSVSSSDEVALKASKTGSPMTGVYDVEVLARAQAHSLASPSMPSQYASLGTGTFNITVGGVTKSIAVDSTNNTLLGLKGAISASGLPVNASIVNDGTGYRLMLASQQTGMGNAISISVADDDGNNSDVLGLSQFAFGGGINNMTQTIAAQDASFKVNGLAMSSSSNQVNNVIEGVQLTLNKAEVGAVKTITIGADNSSLSEKIQSFVDDYNAMDSILDNLGSYTKNVDDPTQGSLAGDSALRGARAELRKLLDFRLQDGSVQSLADVGIRSNRDGTITLDATKLSEAIAADSQAVGRLFAAVGSPSDPQVKFVGASDRTVEGSFALNVSQAARQALYIGNTSAGLATDMVTIDDNNNTFELTLNGAASTSLSLAQGSYTKTDIASMLQSAINNDTNFKVKGYRVNVAFDSVNNRFQMNTESFGSAMSINVTSVDTNMAATLGLAVGSGAAGSVSGQDVAGSLTSSTGTNYTFSGMGERVKITSMLAGSPRDLEFDVIGSAIGSRGTIDFYNGFAAKLSKQITDMQKKDVGLLGQPMASIETQQTKITEKLAKLDERYQLLLSRYTTQFSEANAVQNQMQSLAASLMAQFSRSSSSN